MVVIFQVSWQDMLRRDHTSIPNKIHPSASRPSSKSTKKTNVIENECALHGPVQETYEENAEEIIENDRSIFSGCSGYCSSLGVNYSGSYGGLTKPQYIHLCNESLALYWGLMGFYAWRRYKKEV